MGDETAPTKGPEDQAPADEGEDVVLVQGENERGDACHVVRKRKGRLELGELRAVKEGRPLYGELVKLTRREEHERLFDVEVLAKAPEPEPAKRGGPAQIATDAYRRNWEAIFGPRNRLN